MRVNLTLITFRDVFQWAARHQPALYQERSAVVRLSPPDLKGLGAKEGSHLRLFNSGGEVVVRAKADPRLPPGFALLPVSPYANLLSHYQPERGRLPNFKHIEIAAEVTQAEITPLARVVLALERR